MSASSSHATCPRSESEHCRGSQSPYSATSLGRPIQVQPIRATAEQPQNNRRTGLPPPAPRKHIQAMVSGRTESPSLGCDSTMGPPKKRLAFSFWRRATAGDNGRPMSSPDRGHLPFMTYARPARKKGKNNEYRPFTHSANLLSTGGDDGKWWWCWEPLETATLQAYTYIHAPNCTRLLSTAPGTDDVSSEFEFVN